jgi:acyl-CoA thioesterase FadM
MCPVIDLSIKYLKPLYSLEDIDVEIIIGDFSKVRFTLAYKIFRNDLCVATATATHCFLNSSLKPIPLPPHLLEKFSNLKDEK